MKFRIISKNDNITTKDESYSPEKNNFDKESIRRPYKCNIVRRALSTGGQSIDTRRPMKRT